MISNIPDGHIELAFDAVIIDNPLKYEAILFDFGSKRAWIPRSHVHDYFEDGEGKTVILTEWVATRKGLV